MGKLRHRRLVSILHPATGPYSLSSSRHWAQEDRVSEAHVSWPSGQAGKRHKQTLQQVLSENWDKPGLRGCEGWGGVQTLLWLCCQERLPGKAALSETKDERNPVEAQGALGAKAAGGKGFLACSRTRLGPGRQSGKGREGRGRADCAGLLGFWQRLWCRGVVSSVLAFL